MNSATKNPGLLRFTAVLQESGPTDSGGFVEFPYDLKATFGIGNLVPMVATFDGIEYRGSITKRGGPPLLMIKNDIRARLGKQTGDTIEVTVELDTRPRELEIPVELAEVLVGTVHQTFEALSYTHRKEYVRWVAEAKQAETRQRRAAKAVEMIQAKQSL
jgi:hypothetical protein